MVVVFTTAILNRRFFMRIKMKRDAKWSIDYKAVKFESGKTYQVPGEVPKDIADKMINVGHAERTDRDDTDVDKDADVDVDVDSDLEDEGENEPTKEEDTVKDEPTHDQKKKEDLVPENKAIENTAENKKKSTKKKRGRKPQK